MAGLAQGLGHVIAEGSRLRFDFRATTERQFYGLRHSPSG